VEDTNRRSGDSGLVCFFADRPSRSDAEPETPEERPEEDGRRDRTDDDDDDDARRLPVLPERPFPRMEIPRSPRSICLPHYLLRVLSGKDENKKDEEELFWRRVFLMFGH
jgi:hypothetical protein